MIDLLRGRYKIVAIQRFFDLLVDGFKLLAIALLRSSGGGRFKQRLYLWSIRVQGLGFLENVERSGESVRRYFFAGGFDQASTCARSDRSFHSRLITRNKALA